MRIVQVVDYFQPQLGYQETFFDVELRRKGFKTAIITSDRFFPFIDYNNTVRKILGNRIFGTKGHNEIKKMGFHTINLRILFEYHASVIFLGLWRALNRLNPDLVIVHGIYKPLSIISHLWCLIRRKKIVIDDHMLIKSDSIFKRLLITIMDLVYRVLPDPTLVFVVSDALLDYWGKKRIFKKIEKIPLGVDMKTFFPNESVRYSVRKQLEIPSEGFVLFYSGKIVPQKEVERILHFGKKLSEASKKDIRLLMIGSGEPTYLKKVKRFADQVQIPLYHFPMVSSRELAKFMQAADLGCWFGSIPSASVQELAAVGVPSLCAKGLEASSEISKKILGMNYEPEKLTNILQNLTELIVDEKKFKAIQQSTRIYAEKYLSYENISNLILKKIGFPSRISDS